VKGKGIDNEAVPFDGFTAKVSSMPLSAPPPFGNAIAGASTRNAGAPDASVGR